MRPSAHRRRAERARGGPQLAGLAPAPVWPFLPLAEDSSSGSRGGPASSRMTAGGEHVRYGERPAIARGGGHGSPVGWWREAQTKCSGSRVKS